MKTEGSDQRVRVTKQMIRQAFLKLLSEKPIQRITVRELCETAGINRGTFYMHYQDVFELQEQIEIDLLSAIEESLSEMLKSLASMRSNVDICVRIFQVLKENCDLCVIMLGEYGNSGTVDKITQLGMKIYMSAYKAAYPAIDREKLETYYVFVSAGCIALFKRWIVGGMTIPIEEVAKQTAAILTKGEGYLL